MKKFLFTSSFVLLVASISFAQNKTPYVRIVNIVIDSSQLDSWLKRNSMKAIHEVYEATCHGSITINQVHFRCNQIRNFSLSNQKINKYETGFINSYNSLIMNNIHAQDQTKSTDTSRIARTEKKYQELFGAPAVLNATDPELMTILQRFIFGEVFYIGNLDDKTRELITITALATNQTLPQLKAHTNAALNIGVKPIK